MARLPTKQIMRLLKVRNPALRVRRIAGMPVSAVGYAPPSYTLGDLDDAFIGALNPGTYVDYFPWQYLSLTRGQHTRSDDVVYEDKVMS
jgi:hypothetical protein